MDNQMLLFLLAFALSTLLYIVLANCYVWPYLQKLPKARAISIAVIPHAFRHLGLLGLVTIVVGADLAATDFAHNLAYGDMVAMPLALLSIWALNKQWKSAYGITWLFSILASLDLAFGIYSALTLPITNFQLSSLWLVVTFVIPMLLVSQAMVFAMLMKRK